MSQEDLRTPPRGRSRSWAGPETSFQDDAVTLTSQASPSQEASYFHRSWTGGPPTHPETFLYWEYRHRVPEKTRLKALAAQQHVLDVLAQEQAAERRHRQHEQALRQ